MRATRCSCREASKRGVFAHISDADIDDWQSSIDIVLRRFAEYHDLQGAFGRRALTERAKGILMERHAIDETRAFECCASSRAWTTASSSTSRPPSSTATASYPDSRRVSVAAPSWTRPKCVRSRAAVDAPAT